jgi:TonB family protein
LVFICTSGSSACTHTLAVFVAPTASPWVIAVSAREESGDGSQRAITKLPTTNYPNLIDFPSISRETPLRACFPPHDRRLPEQLTFPQPMLRPELRPEDSSTDPTSTLEQHLRAGFPPDLALDLVLNELVARAAEATHASSAALALARGDEMVCRAATGQLAPDLGVPLNTRDGLSGACLQTRHPQLSVDTEFDPRLDPVVSRRLGIRSILIVPVFDADNNSQFEGILEVFSPSPAAFSYNDQIVLESFAEECARIRRAAIEISRHKPKAVTLPQFVTSQIFPPEFVSPDSSVLDSAALSPRPARRPPYEAWALVLGALTILATIAVSFLIGSRIGWLGPTRSASGGQNSQPLTSDSVPATPVRASTTKSARTRSTPAAPAKTAVAPSADELVVYEKGKLIFRLKPAAPKPDRVKNEQAKLGSSRQDRNGIVEAVSATRIATTNIAASRSVWLSPAQAEARLLSRSEALYPSEALAEHRAGNVVLEVQVTKDGSVSNIRTLSGDPLLAAAASNAVRNWRYQPYRQHNQPSSFQTDVTLSFTLPN